MIKTILSVFATVIVAATALASPTGSRKGDFVKKGSKRKSGIISEIVAQIKHVILDEDDNCGSRDLYYYDNPEQVLQFPSEGVSITISENP
ncbi:MAG: hypothetical protein II824_01640 [Bacteroidales bacterium]|nr:hypothetical protein [Bacteroidales bacterium]